MTLDDCPNFGHTRAGPSGPSCATCCAISILLLCCAGCRLEYYCDQNCQKTNWPKHKATCRRLQELKRQGLTENCEVPQKGRGLVATVEIPKGVTVAFWNVPKLPNGHTKGVELLKYNIGNRNGCFKPCHQEPIQGGFINDPNQISCLLGIQDAESCRQFQQEYQSKVLDNVEVVQDRTNPNYIWAITTKTIKSGEELGIAYSTEYWLDLLASNGIPGAPFRAIWVALWYLIENGLRENLSRHDGSPAILASLPKMLQIDALAINLDGTSATWVVGDTKPNAFLEVRGLVVLVGHLQDTIDDDIYAKHVVGEKLQESFELSSDFEKSFGISIEDFVEMLIGGKNPSKALAIIDAALEYEFAKDQIVAL